MFAADALPQQIGLAVLLASIVFLVVGLVRNARRGAASPLPWAGPGQSAETPPTAASPPETSAGPAAPSMPATPHPMESVELTPAEREAFADLVRQWKTPFHP
ncbi:hypothetical protein AB0I49_27110 [Streptomyces sp. NPDC050617]|uniref:hypothetical protein n=1 Tax=Streptomyces sp. NPDC050617 TaxID=3154628 RepID=UPI003423DFD6